MTIKLYVLIISMLFIPLTTAIAVQISGQKAVKRNDSLHLNCSSDTNPSVKEADIQINGRSHTSVAWLNGECVSRNLRKPCSLDICSCSRGGTWFRYIYKVLQPEGDLRISCSMIFGKYRSISDSIQVRIIELSDPEIRTEPSMPITAGSTVKLTCLLEKTDEDIYFEWNCIEHKTVMGTKVHQHNLTFSTLIIRNLNLTHDNETCTCRVHVESITSKYPFQLSISRIPVIDVSNDTTCGSSSSVTLFCMIHTQFRSFGFNNWIHSRHGAHIRHLTGHKLQTKSVLTINSCSYDDFGNYTCVAFNRYNGKNTFGNKTVSLLVYGPPIIESAETVICNSSSVKLSCIIKTGLPTYGFSPWKHYFNGNFIRTLNGSMHGIVSVLEFETCNYQDAGEYMCTAWNEYGRSIFVANKNISLFVYALPVVISSDVFRDQQTTLSASIYSFTRIHYIWQHSNETIANSTDQIQTLDRTEIELMVYNESIECNGYIVNLSVKSALVGEYILFLSNAFGETRLLFNIDKKSTAAFIAAFDLRVVVFGVITLGIFILTLASGSIIIWKGIQRTNVIHVIGPHERCQKIPIYHSAPALDNTPNTYDTPDSGYLHVINDQYERNPIYDNERTEGEHYTSRYISSNYQEIDI